MSRQARQYSQSGLYHIVFRGMNRHNIFEEEEDFIKIKDIIQRLKKEMLFEIYAFYLMTNHVHILLKEYNIGDITVIMKRLLTRYAGWFNRKYSRSGALIANRFKS
ncbi:Transposase IS200 like [Anaerovirgula multivorans]|uniref:Transposase IS200 like n=1 Tax=Anaerovirgula multivorans TaxID=312168 RepID=A0A239ICQ4_9FIRM|nr:transposase [Anaerovirgula multivorans]SNS90823.1 Transposase IS200 like [Anaerovirgula multivorans]